MPATESSPTPAARARSAVYRMPARCGPPGEVFALICHACQIPGHTHPERAAIDPLAQVHDRMHHQGQPTAQVAAVPAACDICETRRATLAIPVPEPGERPVAVCDSCTAGTGFDETGSADRGASLITPPACETTFAAGTLDNFRCRISLGSMSPDALQMLVPPARLEFPAADCPGGSGPQQIDDQP